MSLLPNPSGQPSDLGERFAMLEELGRGAMGVVYRVQDRSTGEQVALKLLASATPKHMARFAREADVVRQLQHPGIVPLRGFDLAGQTPWIAFQLIHGARPFSEAIPNLDLHRRLQIVRDTAAAAGYAHAQGVIHRDLKAENVLVDSSGRSHLADFGVASLAGADRLTHTGALVGTPYAMSPEQLGGREVGPAADVWALGILLYQALTGRVPYESETLAGLSEEIRAANFTPPSRYDSGIDASLDAICLRCLAARPEDRYPHGGAVAQALDGFFAGVFDRAPADRSWTPLWIALAVVAVGGLAFALGRLGEAREPPAAQQPTQTPTPEPPTPDPDPPAPASDPDPPAPEPDPDPPASAPEPPPLEGDDPRVEVVRQAIPESDDAVLQAVGLLQRPTRERVEQAEKILRKAKTPAASYTLVMLQVSGWLGSDRIATRRLLELLADEVPEARSLLGWDLHVGYSQPRDLKRAGELYRQAIREGSISAPRRLALGIVLHGMPGTQADVEAWAAGVSDSSPLLDLFFHTEYLRRLTPPPPRDALEAAGGRFTQRLQRTPGNTLVLAGLELLYLGRHTHPKVYVPLLRRGTEKGALAGAYLLGTLDRNDPQVTPLFEAAYRAGHVEAQAEFARQVARGVGVTEDPARGLELVRDAAERGSVRALLYLGEWHRLGLYGLTHDPVEARRLLERAVAAGSFKAKAALGQMLVSGQGGPRDTTRAAALLEVGAQRGLVVSMFQLALLLRTGNGVDADAVRALELLRRCSESGHDEATVAFADMLGAGEGAPADPERALERLREAVEAGKPASTTYLGRCYLEGRLGLERDPARARQLLERAVEAGHPRAKRLLEQLR